MKPLPKSPPPSRNQDVKFGWQGFEFDHGDEFGPAVLGGNTQKGYVRLQDGDSKIIQVRWLLATAEPSEHSLDAYFKRLRHDFRKQTGFRIESRVVDGSLRYFYDAKLKASGVARYFPEHERVYLVESLAKHRTGADKELNRAESSFAVNLDRQRWAVLGLNVRLPGPLRVQKSKLLSGRVSLELATRGVRITVERWALAKQLLAQHDYPSWVEAVAKVKGTVSEPTTGLLRIDAVRPFGLRQTVISSVDPVHNQIVFIRAQYRNTRWEPQWDWFDS